VIEDTSTVSVESPAGEVTENRAVTQALFDNAREIFSPKYSGHMKFEQAGNVLVLYRDIWTLDVKRKDKWLNDTIVDAYCALITLRSAETKGTMRWESCFVFSSFLYQAKIVKNLEAIRKLTPGENIFKYEVILPHVCKRPLDIGRIFQSNIYVEVLRLEKRKRGPHLYIAIIPRKNVQR
jgi:Ulp1 family protease